MPIHWTNDPATIGLDPPRYRRMIDRAEFWCQSDELPAISLAVGTPEAVLTPWHGGSPGGGGSGRIDAETIFPVTSITKPLVATLALLLIEEGALTLADRVCEILPEFSGASRQQIRIEHLLTHTSGLPNLLPDDRDLRRRGATLDDFLAGLIRADLDFPPGRSVNYSSCGFLLLGEILSRVGGHSLPELMTRQIFAPLGMRHTALGAPPEWCSHTPNEGALIATVRVTGDQVGGEDWNWNSRYWRTLGAPWGGVLSTSADLARFAQMMVNDGRHESHPFLAPASVAAASTNALARMRDLPETSRRTRPWGLGWRLQWPGHRAAFGDLAGTATYGHWGASGTLLWIDPARRLFAVFLTTQPPDPRSKHLVRLSNMVLAAAG